MKKNKTLLILLLFVLVGQRAFSQRDSLEYYVERLNWNSFQEGLCHFPSLHLSGEIQELIKYSGKEKAKLLLGHLKNDKKTVAIHNVLTKIFDSSFVRFGRNERGGVSSTIEYSFNGLEWTRDYGKIMRL